MTSIKPTKAQQARAVSASEASRLLGKDRGTITRWLDEGCPTVGAASRGDGVEWRIDLGLLCAWLVDRARAEERERLEAKHRPELERLRRALEQASGESGAEPTTWQEARRRRTLAEARLAEIDPPEGMAMRAVLADGSFEVIARRLPSRTSRSSNAKLAPGAARDTSAAAGDSQRLTGTLNLG